MSDTPRTDEAVLDVQSLDYSDKGNVVYADFARQLERENAELRQLLQEAVSDLDDLIKHLQVEIK